MAYVSSDNTLLFNSGVVITPAEEPSEESDAAEVHSIVETQPALYSDESPDLANFGNESDSYPNAGDDGNLEGDSPGLVRASSLGSTTSWYSPSKRRAGLGTQRRNTILFRSVDFNNFRPPSPERKRHKRSDDAVMEDTAEEENVSTNSGSNDDPGVNISTEADAPSDGEPSSSTDSTSQDDPIRTASLHWDQLFAVMERSTRLMWRRKLDFLLEVAVPLIFIAVSIILWIIWGNEYNEEMQYLDYSKISVTEGTIGAAGLTPPIIYDFTCIEQPQGTPAFPYFVSCMHGLHVICDGDPTFLPFPEGTRMCRFNYSFISTWEQLISASLQFYWRQLTAVPTLDSLISLQWTVLTSYKEIIPLISATMAGLAANTRYSSILCSGTLYFVGPQEKTLALINYMDSTSKLFTYVVDRTVYASAAAAHNANNAKKKGRMWAIVELKKFDEQGLDLVLHMNNSALPSFGTTYDDAYSGGVLFDTAELYILSGYSTIQQLVSEFYLKEFHQADVDKTQMIVATGSPAFYRKPLLINAREILPLIYTLAFLYCV
ncbi:putative ATP-binding cassette protein subfamily A member 3, partial [Leptomonas seymouri]